MPLAMPSLDALPIRNFKQIFHYSADFQNRKTGPKTDKLFCPVPYCAYKAFKLAEVAFLTEFPFELP